MNCPKCGSEATKVTGHKDGKSGSIKRRRKCLKCGHTFNTFEFREDDLSFSSNTEATAETPEPERPDSPAKDSEQQVVSCLRGINKKLNVVAGALASLDKKESVFGIQPKKPSKSKKNTTGNSTKEAFQEQEAYNEFVGDDLVPIEERLDPKDIHSWAVLLASLSPKGV